MASLESYPSGYASFIWPAFSGTTGRYISLSEGAREAWGILK
jgi:hypothetical protein